MTTRPLIGILLDFEPSGTFSSRPHHALRTGYFEAVWRAGGLPLGLGYQEGSARAVLDSVRGLLIPGGTYPFPNHYYGAAGDGGGALHPRHKAELALVAEALARDMPVLGICAGMQVIAAQAGLRLFKSLRDDVDCAVDHLDGKPAEETAHAISVAPDTKLRRILAAETLMVNSAHNEAPRQNLTGDAVRDAAAGAVAWPVNLVQSAAAPDGVIEGLERTDHPFCIGVQWHPEFFIDDPDDPNMRLFRAFVEAAGGYAGLDSAEHPA
ncbi:MAG: gamma-glutamyl-gamma-aminobutyrate hydrolase family protein [Rhodospirillaceae bacterium]